jgi:hypothetical protein
VVTVARKPHVDGLNMTKQKDNAKHSLVKAKVDTPAESSTKSLINLPPMLVQHLEQDAAALSTLTESDYFNILIAVLTGYMRNTFSGDVTFFAFENAKGICVDLGMNSEEVEIVLKGVYKTAEQARKDNPVVKALF